MQCMRYCLIRATEAGSQQKTVSELRLNIVSFNMHGFSQGVSVVDDLISQF